MKPSVTATLLLGAALLSFQGLAAAEPPLSPSQEKTGPVLTTELIASSDTELKAGNSDYQHVTFYHAAWGVTQTLPVSATGAFTLGLNYSLTARRITEPSDWEDDDSWKNYKATHPNWDRVPIPRRLQSLTASIEYAQQLNDRWGLNTSVCVGSHVASEGLLSKGRGLSASVIGLYKWSPSLNVALGLAYDSLSQDYRLVPLIGFDWQINDKWSMALGFPSTAVTYALNRRLTMALEVSGSGGTYYIKDDPAPGIAPRSLADSKLETMEIRLGFKTTWKINDTFSISATTGHVLYREFKYIDRDYKLRSRDLSSFAAFTGSIAF